MKYSFTAKGHKNILATHKTTLEFTKDDEVSLDGDCIVGVSADFSLPALQGMLKNHARFRMRIKAGNQMDEIDFIANKNFSSSREIVIRFSEFSSDRTFGFRATKSSKQLDRKLVERLRDPAQQIFVEIEPLVKAVIFDFDDTIEDFKSAKEHAHRGIANLMFERHGVYELTTCDLIEKIDREFAVKARGADPNMFDRRLWFKEYFRRIGVDATSKEVDELVEEYWRLIIEKARPMPNAKSVISELKKEYKVAVMTDSDGEDRFKINRAKSVGLYDIVDLFMISTAVGVSKPSKIFYSKICAKLGVSECECLMVGDKPAVDLKLAKELGMATVWMKHGDWAKMHGNMSFDYVDHEITDLQQLLKIIKGL